MSQRWRVALIFLLVVVAVETALLMCQPDHSTLSSTSPSADGPRHPVPPDKVATALIGRPIYPTAIQTIAFAPDGHSILAGDGLGRMTLFDRDQKTTRQIQVHSNWVFSIRFAATGDRLLTAGGDNRVQIMQWPGLTKEGVFTGHEKDVHAASFLAGGQEVVSVGDDRVARLWSISPTVELRVLTGHSEAVTSVDVDAAGRWIATGSRDDSVRVWDGRADDAPRIFAGHSNDVMALRFLPGGERLVSTGYDGQLFVWNLANGVIARRTINSADKIFALAVDSKGETAATGGVGGIVRLWDMRGTEPIINESRRFQGEGDISSVAFSADGSEIAAGSTTGEIHIWNRTNSWMTAKLSSPFRL